MSEQKQTISTRLENLVANWMDGHITASGLAGAVKGLIPWVEELEAQRPAISLDMERVIEEVEDWFTVDREGSGIVSFEDLRSRLSSLQQPVGAEPVAWMNEANDAVITEAAKSADVKWYMNFTIPLYLSQGVQPQPTEKLVEAIELMEAYEQAGGDGWWRAWDKVKAAKNAAINPSQPTDTNNS